MRSAELLAQRPDAIIQGQAQLEIANHPLGVTPGSLSISGAGTDRVADRLCVLARAVS